MPKPHGLLALVPICFTVLAACDGGLPSHTSTGHGGASGTAGANGSAGANGNAGANGSAGANGTAGANGSAGDNGAAGANGSAGANGAAGANGSAGGNGTAGGNGSAGANGTAGGNGAGGSGVTKRHGMSAGCNKPPGANDSESMAVVRTVHINGLNAVYLKGGVEYIHNKIDTQTPYDYTFRPYGLRLPKGYDPSKPYPVTVGGGGCGGSASGYKGGGGLQIEKTGATLQIGLQMMNGCFDDGGPTIDNRADTPEEPYFRAVMADIEANYCIDLDRVFVSGFSSGGWEAFTLGCAAADLIRGISTSEGGMRAVRPPCKGPIAAIMVAGEADTINPIGPLAPTDPKYMQLGSPGSGPGKDEILTRNGCVGTATKQWNASYPACLQYTGCPAAYPVVWCALPGVSHNSSTYNNINYSPGGMWMLLGSLPPSP